MKSLKFLICADFIFPQSLAEALLFQSIYRQPLSAQHLLFGRYIIINAFTLIGSQPVSQEPTSLSARHRSPSPSGIARRSRSMQSLVSGSDGTQAGCHAATRLKPRGHSLSAPASFIRATYADGGTSRSRRLSPGFTRS